MAGGSGAVGVAAGDSGEGVSIGAAAGGSGGRCDGAAGHGETELGSRSNSARSQQLVLLFLVVTLGLRDIRQCSTD
ncbi:hypothetical protein BDA96_10G169800 [Sorghum bicolor]|uniref:Uncharacterized protein n=2 Tax=Sorghum bicolor TaxID=4558 RepID=A0A921U104_SORBI|nr:hypothetical protein BDA96_10G169800 [Sorghum bicolor]KXG19930.1 hypothetical protein SORBI_3010G135200 [Sorghum bicolor]